MPILPNARLTAQMQRVLQDDFYSDTAILMIDKPTGALDALNNPVVETQEIPIKCSYSDKPSNEIWAAMADIDVTIGEIRFKGPTPTKGNRVKITSRYGGLPIPATVLEIAGTNDRGPFGYVCSLKAIKI